MEEVSIYTGEYFSFLDETYDGDKEKLHHVLVSDPKPFRRDVKQMLSNLLKLINELEMEEIIFLFTYVILIVRACILPLFAIYYIK